ncbi:TonB-dependent receptor domain-containing protein [Phenylobacterium sp.]|uniref:TonB-dependent receptor domain-containing protein n=1 Tax=Phenylobacterium sp. TaxID=1871053 RepID=UPI00356213AC
MSRGFQFAAMAACAALAAPAAAQDAAGAWRGVLIAGPNVLRVVVRVSASPDGKLQGEFLSIDQSPKGFPLADLKVAGGALSFGLPQIYASYEGKWDPARNAWVGVWKQGAGSLPLTLEKGEFAAAPPAPAAAAPKPAQTPAAQTPVAKAGGGKTVEGVTVQGQSNAGMRVDIDRRSYDITKDLQAQTGSIADALRNIPSVQVDVQGNISLRGDPSVTIMVDGKPSSLFKGPSRGQVLQNLPANAFERVEVMTNPSAAFRPDGSGGIINLIPKKARQMGKAGSIRVTVAADDKAQLNFNLSSVGPKLTLSGDAAWAHEKQQVTLDDQRASLDPVSGRFLDSAQHSDVDQTVDLLIGRAAFDYDPDSKTRISGELRGTGIRADADTATSFQGLGLGGAPLAFDRTGTVAVDRVNLAANGSWRRKFGSEPDHELVVDLTQDRNTERLQRNAIMTALTAGVADRAENIRNDTDTDQSHVKVDYTRPFADNAKLKTGYELEYDRSDFDNSGRTGPSVATEVLDASLIDDFRFSQAINGVYATWQQPIDKLTVLAGLRLEDTRIDMKDPTTGFQGSNDYTRFYPSLHLAWKVDDAQELRASYSERIARPQPADYNPFRVYRDPFNFTAGNPDLKPQETHSFELGYQYRKGFTYYLATAYFRDNEKGVTDVVTDLGGGVLLTAKENLTRSQNGGLELVAVGRWGSKLSYQVRGDAFHNEIDASGLGFAGRRSDWTLSGGGSLTYQMTPKDQFQLVGQLTGKRLTPQGYHEPLGLVFGGYRHQFNKDWAFSVSGRDLLNSYRDTLVIDTPALRDRVVTRVKLRAIFLQLTYSFGSGPRKDTGIDYGTSTAGAGPR